MPGARQQLSPPYNKTKQYRLAPTTNVSPSGQPTNTYLAHYVGPAPPPHHGSIFHFNNAPADEDEITNALIKNIDPFPFKVISEGNARRNTRRRRSTRKTRRRQRRY